jgi:hypothetical protein
MLKLYKNKYTLDLMPNGHKYLVNGKEKPGVTSILQILNKPGLSQWAANQTAEFVRLNSVPFPEAEGQKAWVVLDSDLRQATQAYNRSRDNSANVGKKAHQWIERHVGYALGQTVQARTKELSKDRPYSKDIAPCIESFLAWEEQYKPKYLFSERQIYSEKGDYCGTCDVGLIIKIDGKELRVILDFKTGKPEKQFDKRLRRYTNKKRPYSTVFIQDALYDLAIEEEDGIRADRYGVLYLSTNGDLLFGLTEETEAFRNAAKSIVETDKALRTINFLNKWMDV